jgi:hypothetical protein
MPTDPAGREVGNYHLDICAFRLENRVESIAICLSARFARHAVDGDLPICPGLWFHRPNNLPVFDTARRFSIHITACRLLEAAQRRNPLKDRACKRAPTHASPLSPAIAH